ncbi:hypothetical protein ACFU7T_12045 [Streptomyces sp. NPDC057555]|uniref:hypothetical protein n=1 Tax=Streptomyces sp. NPDC057555 TaxID=3346166 RepID=UPI0036A999CF
MDLVTWKPRDLADAATFNSRVRDAYRVLSNPLRMSATGLNKISKIPDSDTYTSLKWDEVHTWGEWKSSDAQSFSVPVSGYYAITADVTALSPKDAGAKPAMRVLCLNIGPDQEYEWIRADCATMVPGTYVTCSLRGIGYADKGNRISLRAAVPVGAGAWEVSPPTRPSTQLNRFAAVLIAPGATHA